MNEERGKYMFIYNIWYAFDPRGKPTFHFYSVYSYSIFIDFIYLSLIALFIDMYISMWKQFLNNCS